MPEHRPAPDAPDRAVDAIIDRILEELSSPPDPETLNRVRAEFRRRVPLHLRSYAAAALLLEAAGQGGRGPRGGRRQEEPRRGRGEEKRRGSEERPRNDRQQPSRRQEAAPEPRPEENRPRYQGEGVTVFFGMGKRQRLYPRVLLRILCEEGGLSYEEIGDIRSFDNYSFADIDPAKAEALIASLDGVEFRGRGIPVSKARKRGAPAEAPAEQGPESGERPSSEEPSGMEPSGMEPVEEELAGGGQEPVSEEPLPDDEEGLETEDEDFEDSDEEEEEPKS